MLRTVNQRAVHIALRCPAVIQASPFSSSALREDDGWSSDDVPEPSKLSKAVESTRSAFAALSQGVSRGATGITNSVFDFLVRSASEAQKAKYLEKLSIYTPMPHQLAATTVDLSPDKRTVLCGVLGEQVADLGFKHVYLCPLSSLVAVPVWEKQRSFREQRVKIMAADLAKSAKADGILTVPGIITLAELEGDVDRRDRLRVVDGQHRIGALGMLAAQGVIADADSYNVLVEVVHVPDHGHISSLFSDINKAEPVRLVDMPGVAKDAVRDILTQAVSALETAEKFAPIFKNTHRCRPPHIHADSLRDDLFQADIIKRHNISDADGLLRWLAGVNAEMRERSDERWMEGRNEAFRKALAKARKHDLYLGLDKEWMAY